MSNEQYKQRDWSENEVRLFESLENKLSGLTKRPPKLWEILKDNPISYYRQLVEAVFLFNIQGPDVEALRWGMYKFEYCNVYRRTPEFEEWLKF